MACYWVNGPYPFLMVVDDPNLGVHSFDLSWDMVGTPTDFTAHHQIYGTVRFNDQVLRANTQDGFIDFVSKHTFIRDLSHEIDELLETFDSVLRV